MAALLTFLAALLARALQQTLGDPCRERDPSSRRSGLDLRHVGLGEADPEVRLLARRP